MPDQKSQDEYGKGERTADQGDPDCVDDELRECDRVAGDGKTEQARDGAVGELAAEHPGQYDPETEDADDGGDLCRAGEQAVPVQSGGRSGLSDELGVSAGHAEGDPAEQCDHAEDDGEGGDQSDQ